MCVFTANFGPFALQAAACVKTRALESIQSVIFFTVKNVVVQGWTKNCAPLAIYLRSEECTASAVVPLIRVPLFLTATQPLLYLLYLKYPIQVDRVLEHVAFLMVHIDSTKLP